MRNFRGARGFTLIELLVVISIIGLLSSVVLASLNSARVKARVSSIQQEMVQFRTLIQQSFDVNRGYDDLISVSNGPNAWGVWLNQLADCDYSYGPSSSANTNNPTAAVQALQICKKIIALANPNNSSGPQGGYTLLIGNSVGGTCASGGGVHDKEKFSINVWPGNGVGKLYCMGSKGNSFNYDSGSCYSLPGCYYDP